MKVRYTGKKKAIIHGLGVFDPEQVIETDETAKYLKTGYFELVKEKKKKNKKDKEA